MRNIAFRNWSGEHDHNCEGVTSIPYRDFIISIATQQDGDPELCVWCEGTIGVGMPLGPFVADAMSIRGAMNAIDLMYEQYPDEVGRSSGNRAGFCAFEYHKARACFGAWADREFEDGNGGHPYNMLDFGD